jgi:hypothetical protein
MERSNNVPDPPAELPDVSRDVTIEIAFLPFDPADPALRARASVALHAIGLLVTGFEIRQWPGVHEGLPRVEFPRGRGVRHVVTWNLRLRDAIAHVYTTRVQERLAGRAPFPLYCCPAVATFLKEPPVHSLNCPGARVYVGGLHGPSWAVDELDCLAAEMTDRFAAGRPADVCKRLATLDPLEAALVAVRILAPAPDYAAEAPDVEGPQLAAVLSEQIVIDRQ